MNDVLRLLVSKIDPHFLKIVKHLSIPECYADLYEICTLRFPSKFLSFLFLQTVSRHFRNIPVNEKETLTYFIYMVKSSKSRLDQKGDGGKPLD